MSSDPGRTRPEPSEPREPSELPEPAQGLEPLAELRASLNQPEPAPVRMVRVTGFEDGDVLVELTDPPDEGVIPRDELSRRGFTDPSEIVAVGQWLAAEVIHTYRPRGRVLLSAAACEDPALRSFLLGLRRGEVCTGVVSALAPFGVFVRLDGQPPGRDCGLIRVPELSRRHFDHPSEIVAVGERLTMRVLLADTRRGQASLSLKDLSEDPAGR